MTFQKLALFALEELVPLDILRALSPGEMA